MLLNREGSRSRLVTPCRVTEVTGLRMVRPSASGSTGIRAICCGRSAFFQATRQRGRQPL